MIILIDCDGVLSDFIGGVCETLADIDLVAPEHFTSYRMQDHLTPDEYEFAVHCIEQPGFCRNLEWYSDAEEFLDRIKLLGDVYCLTAPWRGSATWAGERVEWLAGHIPADRVISCPSKSKHLVHGDILIEDHYETTLRWADAHPDGTAIVLRRPWNETELDRHLHVAPNVKIACDYREIFIGCLDHHLRGGGPRDRADS